MALQKQIFTIEVSLETNNNHCGCQYDPECCPADENQPDMNNGVDIQAFVPVMNGGDSCYTDVRVLQAGPVVGGT
jgi:hypothetical protein